MRVLQEEQVQQLQGCIAWCILVIPAFIECFMYASSFQSAFM